MDNYWDHFNFMLTCITMDNFDDDDNEEILIRHYK